MEINWFDLVRQDSLFESILGESLKIILGSLDYCNGILWLEYINIGHVIVKPCVLFELDMFDLWGDENPVS